MPETTVFSQDAPDGDLPPGLSRTGARRPGAVAASLASIAAIGVALPLLLGGCSALFRPAPPQPGGVEFTQPLRLPALAESRMEGDIRIFSLTADEARTAFVPEGEAATLGYNGDYLGPTLVAARGERVRVDLQNDLDAATTLHWHGMHLPAAQDGGPHQVVPAGEAAHPEWTIDQPAATLWYHPHLHEETRAQVDAGLAGMFLVRDDEEAALDLPRDYGVDDFPLIVQDRSFNQAGGFTGGVEQFDGALGDTILVNGIVGPYLDVSTERVRLRLLNGSSARMYDFAFADDRPFELIATDGGLLSAPVRSKHIALSPGERAEIVVRMAPGESVVLRSDAPNPDLHAGGDAFDVLELRAAASLSPSPEVPAALATLPAPDPGAAAAERSFEMSGHDINDREMDMTRTDFVATVDTSEVWSVTNTNPLPHSFHVHDTQFRILSIDGSPPPPHLAGYKDTIALPWNRTYRLLVRFDDYADPTTPYMYHCHLLWHEDQGMMGQFLVVEPGQRPALKTHEGETDDRHDH
ncbi:multicopper oxidase family protein [Microbacterium sp. DT81.1]|uniref:multicopper oxidase family protein n=1 Tax=Microbacterium sp. DT81.1 TaxID=3393413 RepID=UPI003CEBF2C8